MVYRILVASYTNDISTLVFDPEAPSLTLASTITVGHHPSWITPHPTDKTIVFTALEQADGKLIALKVDLEGHLTVVGEAPSGGADPCSLVVVGDELLAANYSSGAFTVMPLSTEPPYFLAAKSDTTPFTGTGPNADRQEGSHLHQVAPHPTYDELFVPDLGADKVRRLVRGSSGRWVEEGAVDFKPGSGPRHVAFHGDVMYTLLELSSELTAHRLPPLPGPPTLLATVPTLAQRAPPPDGDAMLAAEVLAPPPNAAFPAARVYVSNRNDPAPGGDTIAVFDADGAPRYVGEVRSGLRHLRGMVFGGPDDRWLVAGGVMGGGVKVFERVEEGKGLREIAAVSLEAPTGFLWL